MADAFSIHQTEHWFSFFRFRIRRPRVVLRQSGNLAIMKISHYERAANTFFLGFVVLCTCATVEGFQLRPPRHHCPSAHPSSVRPSSSHPSSSSTSVSLATSASSVSSFRPRPRALTPLTGSQASMRWQLYLRRALSVLAFRLLVLMTVFESTRILVL